MVTEVSHLLSDEGLKELILWIAPSHEVYNNDFNGVVPYIKPTDEVVSTSSLTIDILLEKELIRLLDNTINKLEKRYTSINTESERRDYVLSQTNRLKLALEDWSTLPGYKMYPEVQILLRKFEQDVNTVLETDTYIASIKSPASSDVKRTNFPVFTFKYYANTQRTDRLIQSILYTGWVSKIPFNQSQENLSQVKKDLISIFIGKNNNRPVVWIGEINQLYYLTKQLFDNNLLIGATRRNYWDMAVNSFLNSDKTKFEKRTLQTTNPPASTAQIDNIIDHI